MDKDERIKVLTEEIEHFKNIIEFEEGNTDKNEEALAEFKVMLADREKELKSLNK